MEFLEACQKGNLERVKECLKRRNIRSQIRRINWFQGYLFACENGHIDLVSILHKKLKEIQQEDFLSRTAALAAACKTD